MVTVLTIVDKLNVGGIEKTLLGCVEVFQQNNIETHILCKPGGDLEDQFINKNVFVHHQSESRIPIIQLFIFLKTIIKFKIQVIHLRNGHTSGFFVFIGKMLGKFLIVSIHNETPMFKRGWQSNFFLDKLRKVYLQLQKILIIRFSDRIVGHSKANLNYYKEYLASIPYKFLVIYNGVNFDKLKFNFNSMRAIGKTDKIKIIHVGSFKHQKNHLMLINIFSTLIDRGYNLSLDLCGDGDLLKEIKHLSKNLDVRFHGNVKDLSELFSQAHILLFPSFHEGFGNVNIEAQYMRVAICCSDIKPHYESVYPVYHKYFFKLDSIEHGADKCESLILDLQTEEFNRVLEDAHNFSLKFTNINMARSLSKLYKNAQ